MFLQGKNRHAVVFAPASTSTAGGFDLYNLVRDGKVIASVAVDADMTGTASVPVIEGR